MARYTSREWAAKNAHKPKRREYDYCSRCGGPIRHEARTLESRIDGLCRECEDETTGFRSLRKYT